MTARHRWWPALILGVAAGLLPVAASAQGGYTGAIYMVQVETADGDRTDAVYLLNSVDVERGIVRTTATLPFLIEQSHWIDPALGSVESPWNSGLADPIVRVDVETWHTATRSAVVRLSGAVKVPVASVDDGFSSGQLDYALGVSWSIFRGRQSVLADVTWWIPGDPPDLDYRSNASFYVGYGRVLDRRYRWSLVVSASGGPSAIPGADATAQFSAGILHAFGTRTSLGVTLDFGLTDGAADFAVGTMWRVGF